MIRKQGWERKYQNECGGRLHPSSPHYIFYLGEDAALVYNARHRDIIKLEHPGVVRSEYPNKTLRRVWT